MPTKDYITIPLPQLLFIPVSIDASAGNGRSESNGMINDVGTLVTFISTLDMYAYPILEKWPNSWISLLSHHGQFKGFKSSSANRSVRPTLQFIAFLILLFCRCSSQRRGQIPEGCASNQLERFLRAF